MHEPGSVERTRVRLAPNPRMGELTQRLVEHRHELTQRLGLSCAPAVQQKCDLRVIRRSGCFQGPRAEWGVHDTWCR